MIEIRRPGSGLKYMGSTECLVVVDLHEEGGDPQAVAEIHGPLAGETVWFSWEDAAAPRGQVLIGLMIWVGD